MHRNAEYDRLQCIFLISLPGLAAVSQVDRLRPRPSAGELAKELIQGKNLSGSCIFLTLWVFLQTAQNLHMAGPLDDFSNYLGGKNLFKLSDSIQYTKFYVLFHAQTPNILTF